MLLPSSRLLAATLLVAVSVLAPGLAQSPELLEDAVAYWRVARACFDFDYFRAASPDLPLEWGEDALWAHWTRAGFAEFRPAQTKCPTALQAAPAAAGTVVSVDPAAALAFWNISKAMFDFGFYSAANPDLAGMDAAALWAHWASAGLAEGRRWQRFVVDIKELARLEREATYAWLRRPQDPGALAWLDAFQEGRKERVLPPALPTDDVVRWLGATLAGCGGPRPARRNLVISAVGDHWNEERWLDNPRRATFDLAILYIGGKASWRCRGCVATFRNLTEYRMYRALHELEARRDPGWAQLLGAEYGYVALLHEEVKMSTCDLNTYFATLEQFSITLGVPSTCHRAGSFVQNGFFYQFPELTLRYTSITGLHAATFGWGFFTQVVRSTLPDAQYTGFGLEDVWPLLLHQDNSSIAVVDLVCMSLSKPAAQTLQASRARFEDVMERQGVFQKYNVSEPMFGEWFLGRVLLPVEFRKRGGTPARSGWKASGTAVSQLSLLLALCVFLTWTYRRRRHRFAR